MVTKELKQGLKETADSQDHYSLELRYGNNLNVHRQMNKFFKMWYIHIVEYYSSLKTKDILTHSIKNMDVKTLCQMKKARHKRMNFG